MTRTTKALLGLALLAVPAVAATAHHQVTLARTEDRQNDLQNATYARVEDRQNDLQSVG